MTTTTAQDTTSRSDSRNPALYARAYRATGYCRLHVGPLARGTVDDTPVALVVPVEQVVAADARTRQTGGAVTVNITGPDHLHTIVTKAVSRLAAHFTMTGEIRVTIRPPVGATGFGLTEAAAVAAMTAVARAEELPLTPHLAARLAAETGAGTSGLAYGGPALVDPTTGKVLHPVDEPARLHLVVARPKSPDDVTDTTNHPVVVPPADLNGAGALAQWLTQCVGAGDSPVVDVMQRLVATCAPVLGVIGGRTPGSPIVALLPGEPEHLLTAQHLAVAAQAAVKDTLPDDHAPWQVTVTKTAAPVPVV